MDTIDLIDRLPTGMALEPLLLVYKGKSGIEMNYGAIMDDETNFVVWRSATGRLNPCDAYEDALDRLEQYTGQVTRLAKNKER